MPVILCKYTNHAVFHRKYWKAERMHMCTSNGIGRLDRLLLERWRSQLMNRIVRSIFLILVLAVFATTPLLAQPIGGPPPCWPPPCIPIDGGLGFLIAAGALLGGRKVLDRSRKTRQ
jgi:hypothetical protein